MTQNSIFRTVALFIGGIGVVLSCTKPTSFGEELLVNEIADYDTLTLPVVCTIEREDSVQTTDKTSSALYFLCGSITDPVFGTSKADIYTQITHTSDRFNFKNAVFDSAVLILPYALDGFYGDTMIPQTLRVSVLTDTFKNRIRDFYYSNNTINTGEEIGRVDNFLPRPRTAKNIFDTAANAIKIAHIRVPLSATFGQQILALDSTTIVNDGLLRKQLKGLKIESEASAAPGCIMGLNLNTTRCLIRLYYTRNDTLHTAYDLLLSAAGNIKFSNFEHDYANTTAASQLGMPNPDRLYIQGMGGLRVKMEVQGAAALENILINKAQLEVNAVSGQTQNGLFGLPKQLLLAQRNNNDTLIIIPDVNYLRGNGASEFDFFGGQPTKQVFNGTNVDRYYLTMSKHLQALVDDTSNDPRKQTMYLTIFPQRLSASRAVLEAGASPLKASIKVKYTKL
jgi:hypothetical protein